MLLIIFVKLAVLTFLAPPNDIGQTQSEPSKKNEPARNKVFSHFLVKDYESKTHYTIKKENETPRNNVIVGRQERCGALGNGTPTLKVLPCDYQEYNLFPSSLRATSSEMEAQSYRHGNVIGQHHGRLRPSNKPSPRMSSVRIRGSDLRSGCKTFIIMLGAIQEVIAA
jgi:hypothetical protein